MYRIHIEAILKPEQENEIDLFFKAMSATVKKFNPHLNRLISAPKFPLQYCGACCILLISTWHKCRFIQLYGDQ